MTYRSFIAVLFAVALGCIANAGDGVYSIDNFTAETVPLWRSHYSKMTAKPEGAEFTADFQSNLDADRTSFDRDFDSPIDISEFSRFEIELEVENPEAFSYSSLYFRSGDGWYRGTSAIPTRRGVMTYRRSELETEGSPAGLNKIEGVRLSLWRGQSVNSRVTYFSLRCIEEPVLFISVPNSEGVVPWVGTNNGRLIQPLLKELGLAADTIALPVNVDESWFKRFDNRGAVVLVSDRHLSKDLKTLIEAQAKKRGVPLMILSDDLREKPLEKPDLLAFLMQSDALKASIRQYMLKQATTAAGKTVPNAEKTVAEMSQIEREQGFPEFIEACLERHDEELYNAAAPLRDSKALPFRGWWNHSGFGAYKGDWERTAAELEQAGFTAVFPNMVWSGEALYPSDFIPPYRNLETYGDQLDACVKACHRHGIQVHVWKVNFNLQYHVSKERLEQFRQEGRLQKDSDGEDYPWLCPSNPKNIELEVNSMVEIATKYPVDGVHFDYIRYYGQDFCFCDGCRAKFEEYIGRKVENWPHDCKRGELKEQWTRWRAGLITNIVRTTHKKVKAVRPDCKISAAVFIQYPNTIDGIGQDWGAWANEGIVDFLCPMNYTLDAQSYGRFYVRQKQFVKPDFPLYPGIGEWKLSPDETISQMLKANELGCPGFMIFDLTEASAGRILPLLKKK